MPNTHFEAIRSLCRLRQDGQLSEDGFRVLATFVVESWVEQALNDQLSGFIEGRAYRALGDRLSTLEARVKQCLDRVESAK